jgi:hypothetical protein
MRVTADSPYATLRQWWGEVKALGCTVQEPSVLGTHTANVLFAFARAWVDEAGLVVPMEGE